MAIEIDFATKVITVPQADCTLVSGTFYRLPTKDTFKAQVGALMDNEEYIWMDYPIDHNPSYTVAGVTYAAKVEIVNGYTVEFTPNSAWSVELADSNNNLWDIGSGVLVQNQVQVIPTNAAGLQLVSTGSGLSPGQDAKLTAVHGNLDQIEGTMSHSMMLRIIFAMLCNEVVDAETSRVTFKSANGLKNRIMMDADEHGNRSNIAWDLTE